MTLWGVSGTMVIFLAALKNVPRELYEVASLDGAGRIRQFFSITVPMISSAIFFNTIVLTIAAMQVFDQAYLLFWRDQTNASPDSSLFYGVYLFQQAFRQFDFGLASAMAWLLFVIIMLITLGPGEVRQQVRLLRRRTLMAVTQPSAAAMPVQAQPAVVAAAGGHQSDRARGRTVDAIGP